MPTRKKKWWTLSVVREWTYRYVSLVPITGFNIDFLFVKIVKIKDLYLRMIYIW